MSMTDPVADMLTRIRNGQKVALETVSMPSSKLKESIAKVLEAEGFVAGYNVTELPGNKRELTVELKYFDGRPAGDREA